MLVECNHCGAPLDVSGRETVVACAYCNRQHRLPRMRTIAPDTPVDWKPPRVWTPPEQVAARKVPLHLHPVKLFMGVVWTLGRTLIAGVTLLALAVVAITLFGSPAAQGVHGSRASRLLERFADADARAAARERVEAIGQEVLDDEKVGKLVEAAKDRLGKGTLSALMWDGSEPYVCSGNAQATLRGVHAALTGRTAIVAEGNCALHVVECECEAWEGLKVSGNAEVVIERSRLHTKGTGITLAANGRVELVESTVESDGVGASGSGNAELILASGRLGGGEQAIVLSGNAHGEVREAEVVGPVRARKGRLEGYPKAK